MSIASKKPNTCPSKSKIMNCQIFNKIWAKLKNMVKASDTQPVFKEKYFENQSTIAVKTTQFFDKKVPSENDSAWIWFIKF